MDLSRRGLLGLGMLAPLAAGCASEEGGAAPTTTAGDGRTPSATPSEDGTTPTLPAVRRWRPSPGDLEPACKQAAVAEVLRRTTTTD